MLGEIIDAVIKEILAIPDFQCGTIMLKTDFKMADITSYQMPFVLIDVPDATDSRELIGGITMVEWVFGLNSYNYQPDGKNDDTTGYTPKLLNVIDTLRRHFSKGIYLQTVFGPGAALIAGQQYTVAGGNVTYNQAVLTPGANFTALPNVLYFSTTAGGTVICNGWLTPQMAACFENYNLRFTLGGISPADALEGDGLVMGYKLLFDSVGLDFETGNTEMSSQPLAAVLPLGGAQGSGFTYILPLTLA